MNIYGKYEATLHQILDDLMQRFNQINQDYLAKHQQKLFEHLNGRVKSQDSMIQKCQRKDLPLTAHSALRENRDSIGLRIVCNFIDDIFHCKKLIEDMPDIKIVKEKDYITHAKKNGYRSYHLILMVTVPDEDVDGQKPGHFYVELQLRTIAMDTWAALEHEINYKHEIKNPELIGQELKQVSDELASCDVKMQTIRQLIREDEK